MSTDWDIFHESDLNKSTEVITAYINFCVDVVIPQKTIKLYPNNKPYITKDVKDCIKRKRAAFRNKGLVQLRSAQRELKQELNIGKNQYKESIEKDFCVNNTKKLWATMKLL